MSYTPSFMARTSNSPPSSARIDSALSRGCPVITCPANGGESHIATDVIIIYDKDTMHASLSFVLLEEQFTQSELFLQLHQSHSWSHTAV